MQFELTVSSKQEAGMTGHVGAIRKISASANVIAELEVKKTGLNLMYRNRLLVKDSVMIESAWRGNEPKYIVDMIEMAKNLLS